MDNILKICTHCQKTKPIEEYAPSKNTKDKKTVWCNDCRLEYGRKYYYKNKEKMNRRRRPFKK